MPTDLVLTAHFDGRPRPLEVRFAKGLDAVAAAWIAARQHRARIQLAGEVPAGFPLAVEQVHDHDQDDLVYVGFF